MNSNDIGPLVRRRRDSLGLSLSELSAKSGVSISFISRVENDISEPGPVVAIRLARALRVPTEVFLNAMGLTTTEQRAKAVTEFSRLIGDTAQAEVPVVGPDGEPTGETRVVELAHPDDVFVLAGAETPWDGDLVLSRTRLPTDNDGVVVRQDDKLRAGTYRQIGRRRSWVEFPDGSTLDLPEEAFVILSHG